MLTPLDIQNKQFSRAIRGYNETEVEDFLAMIVRSMEELIQVNIETTAKIADVEQELQRYKSMENTINEAMILAQKTSEDMIHNATEKSAYIVERGEDQAKKIINEANNEVMAAVKRHEEVKHELKAFQTKFKVLLESQLSVVNAMIDEEK